MSLEGFRNKKVALLGFGVENRSLLEPLMAVGAQVEIRNAEPVPVIPSGVHAVVGAEYLANLDGFDYLFRSPGMSVETAKRAVSESNCQGELTTATDLFLSLGLGRVVGVTGTKGKGTTAKMLDSILEAARLDHLLVGNIGDPVFTNLHRIKPETVVVFELSSFQLEDTKRSPELAVILPVGLDHQEPLSASNPNFHHGQAAYWQAKGGICRYQTIGDKVIFAADSPGAVSVASEGAGEKIRVGLKGDYRLEDGLLLLPSGQTLDLASIGITSPPYQLNAALAAAAAANLEISPEKISLGLTNFKPLPHRQEVVGTFNGVRVIDDSYATTPEAAMAALEGWAEPIHWIAGGSSKGADFNELASTAGQLTNLRSVWLIGQEAPRLATALAKAKATFPVNQVGNLETAVNQLWQKVASGDVVILSPAAASKDQFINAEQRGERFQELIKQLVGR